MSKILLLGYEGFVGRAVYRQLLKDEQHDIFCVDINDDVPAETFDLVINCAGNAKKYLAEAEPLTTYKIELDVFMKLMNVHAKAIIHISSIEASCVPKVGSNFNYATQKYDQECRIKEFATDNCLILRLGGLFGIGLSKNVVYDLLSNHSLRTQLESEYNLINIEEVALIINKIVDSWNVDSKYGINETINIAASKSISVAEIADILGVSPKVLPEAKLENYQIDTKDLQEFFPLKTSREYLQNYIGSEDCKSCRIWDHMKTEHQKNHNLWLQAGGPEKMVTFPGIDENSCVFDIGLYKGLWSEAICKKYNPNLYAFEPITEFFYEAEKRLCNYPKARLFNYGVGSFSRPEKIVVSKDSSSLYLPDRTNAKSVYIKGVASILRDLKIDTIDLVEINIEGGEYELLESLIVTGNISKFKRLLIQFHRRGPDYAARKAKIWIMLSQTHKIVYDYDYIFEYWEIK